MSSRMSKGKASSFGFAGASTGLQAHEIGVERVEVVAGDEVIGGVWHCRIERMPEGAALDHGRLEAAGGPSADSRLGVRRDVGGVDGAEGRGERQAAGEIEAALGGVARGAIAGDREVAALLDERRILGLLADITGLVDGPRRCGEAESHAASGNDERNKRADPEEEAPHHRDQTVSLGSARITSRSAV